MLDFHTQARQLSLKTYQENLLHLGLPDSSEFREKMLVMAQGDQVRAFLLYVRERPVAYLYCPVREGILSYDLLGYDPEFRALSPVTVLQYLAFEQLFQEKQFRAFDFEEGEGQHKRQFATQRIECCNLLVFRPGLKSLTYIFVNQLLVKITSGTLWLLDAVSLRGRVRRLLR